MIDRRAVEQQRRKSGCNFITMWVKMIPSGSVVKIVVDKEETVERMRFLFLSNSGDYGPESWGYMLLPSESGLWFLDETVRMHSETLTGYMPGDRTFAMYGVGEPGAGKEVVLLHVSAGGGRTSLNHRTVSSMVLRYFRQNVPMGVDERGRNLDFPVNIRERVMLPRWGSMGSPVRFPDGDFVQLQLRNMSSSQMLAKNNLREQDRLALIQAEKVLLLAAHKSQMQRQIRAKQLKYEHMLEMIQSQLIDADLEVSTGDYLDDMAKEARKKFLREQ